MAKPTPEILGSGLAEGAAKAIKGRSAQLDAAEDAAMSKLPVGMLEKGTLKLDPKMRPLAVNVDDEEVVIPTVDKTGRKLTSNEAVEQYRKRGDHFGKFESQEHSNAYLAKP